MNSKSIEVMTLNEFLGHKPRTCEICHRREAAVFMVAREGPHAAKAHVCLGCFELAESTGFASIVESVSLREFNEVDEDELQEADVAILDLTDRFHHQRRFILFGPTSRHLDAHSLENPGPLWLAVFPARPPPHPHPQRHAPLHPNSRRLFAKFTPQPKELDRSVAERAFALIQQFDPTLGVFQLYCIEELSAAEVAHDMEMSKTAVIRRLNEIRKRTGLNPKDLRRMSTHFPAANS